MTEVKFAGQVALVTGASRGIGAAIAAELVAKGLIVVGTATSDEGAAKISAALKALPGAADGCRGAKLDVNDVAAAEALIDEITKAHGALHVLVNNIDVAVETDADRIRDALFRQAFGPVRWVECVQAIKARGITTLVECGPGKVLAGMTKRIDAELTGAPLFDPATLAEVKTLLA